MDLIQEGSASLAICGGRRFRFTAQRVVPCFGNRAPGFGYSPLSVEKSDLRKFPKNPEVTVNGLVIEMLSHRVLANARIEVWHCSPKTKNQHQRAHFYTDGQGRYRFITNFPMRENGKNYHIFFKITYGHQSFFTKLSFNHSLAFISSLNTTVRSKPHPEARQPIGPGTTSASFQFNIHLPVKIQELPLHHRMDTGHATV